MCLKWINHFKTYHRYIATFIDSLFLLFISSLNFLLPSPVMSVRQLITWSSALRHLPMFNSSVITKKDSKIYFIRDENPLYCTLNWQILILMGHWCHKTWMTTWKTNQNTNKPKAWHQIRGRINHALNLWITVNLCLSWDSPFQQSNWMMTDTRSIFKQNNLSSL